MHSHHLFWWFTVSLQLKNDHPFKSEEWRGTTQALQSCKVKKKHNKLALWKWIRTGLLVYVWVGSVDNKINDLVTLTVTIILKMTIFDFNAVMGICGSQTHLVFIPPQTNFGRYIGITLSVRPSVRLPVCLFTSCSGHNSLLPWQIWIIFHTIVVQDLRVCHDLDPRWYLQGQGHSAHIPKIRVRAITPHCHVGSW